MITSTIPSVPMKGLIPKTEKDYGVLKGILEERGFFNTQPLFYATQAILWLGLYAVGIALLVYFPTPLWVKLVLVAPFMAVVFTHLGYIIHDAGHRQVTKSPNGNDAILIGLEFLVGMLRSWWVDEHNRHHSYPNDFGRDPHTDIPGFAFSPKQWAEKVPFFKFATRFQAFYFYPILFLEGFGIRLASALYLVKGKARYQKLEAVGFVTHLIVYVVLLAVLLGPWAVVFIIVHTGLTGFYMGMVFAPNHKGRKLLEDSLSIDFMSRERNILRRNPAVG